MNNPPLWFSISIIGLAFFMIAFMVITYIKGMLKELKRIQNDWGNKNDT